MYLNFMFLGQSLFELSCKNTHGNTHTDTHTEAHNTVSEVCSLHVVAFCKNTIIINTIINTT